MKKLTRVQVEELFKLVERNAIKYYDVQLEIVDHYATAIEEIWQNEPNLSFYHAQKRVYNEFWDFKNLEMEKRKFLEKKYRLAMWKSFKEWFSFPKILISFFAFLIVFQIVATSSFWTDILLQTIFYSTLFICLVSPLNAMRRKSKWKIDLLEMESIGVIMSIPQVFGIFTIQWTNMEWLFPMNFVLSLFIISWGLWQIIGYQIYNRQLAIAKNNYRHTIGA